MEELTKTCRICGETLPLGEFKIGRGGSRSGVCNRCVADRARETRAERRASAGGGRTRPFSDPDFDGKEPGEVVRWMGRAKRWLESRGYEIALSGEYRETKIKKLKFE